MKNRINTIIYFLLVSILFVNQTNYGDVKLPKLVSDGMVLQRNSLLKIWGWADQGEIIRLNFFDKSYSTTADSKGNWIINLPPLEEGGPFEMEIIGKNKIVLKDILIGDVWVASGQSNMQTPMSRVRDLYEDVITNCKNNKIRFLTVPINYNFNNRQEDIKDGKWTAIDSESILNFSAVAYFFAKSLFEKYNIPVGIILSAVGGSPAEAWVSEDVIKEFPHHLKKLEIFKNDDYVKQVTETNNKIYQDWYSKLNRSDLGISTIEEKWYDINYQPVDWEIMNLPAFWDEAGLTNVNGVVWFRKEFEVPEIMTNKQARLNLGRIVDGDSTYINGKFVGSISYQYPPRIYRIPAGVLKPGKNVIVVRVVNEAGRGGFIKDKPYNIIVGDQEIDLTGEWEYKVGAVMERMQEQVSVQHNPVGFFNGMIAPLLNYAIKGVIWYQGESNTGRAEEYQKLFPSLINDWRSNWKLGNFPFLYVQLPNFMESKNEPSESEWAELRESQLKTLSVDNTGMAVAIDLGEWNDIHPWRKREVGDRLALLARKIAYDDKEVIASGQIYESMKIEDGKIILSFSNIGNGLISIDGNELKHFAIAGSDKKFVWANAKIIDNKVIVWNENIKNPAEVRYAWADNPEGANLYNREGLPASPFRAINN